MALLTMALLIRYEAELRAFVETVAAELDALDGAAPPPNLDLALTPDPKPNPDSDPNPNLVLTLTLT